MRFMIFSAALLVSTAALAAPAPDFSGLATCKSNAECVVVEPVCPGPWLAVNRAHEAEYNKNLPNVAARTDCLMRAAESKPAMPPVCNAGKCALK